MLLSARGVDASCVPRPAEPLEGPVPVARAAPGTEDVRLRHTYRVTAVERLSCGEVVGRTRFDDGEHGTPSWTPRPRGRIVSRVGSGRR
jgi:hypothetical protein